MRYRMFLDHSLEGIWCLEFDEPIDLSLPMEEQFELVYKHGYMAEVNNAYAKHLGFESGEEMVGTRIGTFLSRSDPTNIATVKAWIRARYTIKNVETVESYQDGITRVILNNAVGIIESGHVVRVWGTETDITERKQAEKALLQSKNFNKAVLNTIDDHIVVTDRNGCILTVNDPWMRFACENDADISLIGPGVNYLDVCRRAACEQELSEAEQKIVDAALKGLNAVLNGNSSQFALKYPCHAPTEKRWFQMVALPFTGEKGGMVVAHRDITDLKMTEEKLFDAQRKYRTVADFTYDWEYWRAPDGRMLYVSPSCERITGYRPADFIDEPGLVEYIILPEFLDAWKTHNHVEKGRFEKGECQFRIRTKDGSTRWIDHICQSVYDEQGRYTGVRASNRDITAFIRASQEAREYKEILAHWDRTANLEQMAAAIAHELNQPLTGILSNAQAGEMLFRQGNDKSPEIGEILVDIIADSKRSAEILRNLRHLFSPHKNTFTELNLNAQIDKTLRILNSEFVFNNITVHTNFSDNLPLVSGNKIQLQQIMINLIRNSIQSMRNMESDPRSISIFTARKSDKEIEIQVEDTGPGIPENVFETIFDPLTTSKTRNLGMGLSICLSIVQVHGGRIWAENRSKGGARILFTLPAAEEIS